MVRLLLFLLLSPVLFVFVRARVPALLFVCSDAFVDEGDDRTTDGDIRKAAVFGALDGVLTSFAIVAGAAGRQLSLR